MAYDYIHLGYIKVISLEEESIIVDLDSNEDVYFKYDYAEKTYFYRERDEITHFQTGDIVAFRADRKPDGKVIGYDIKHPYRYKDLLKVQIEPNCKLQNILRLTIPSLYTHINYNIEHDIMQIRMDYDIVFHFLYKYVCEINLDEILDEFNVKTEYTGTSTTRDYDRYWYGYRSVIGEKLRNKISILKSYPNFENNNLTIPYYGDTWHCYSCFDFYLYELLSKSKTIDETESYGTPRKFFESIDRTKLEEGIPGMREIWIKEIKNEYNKVEHFKQLCELIKPKFKEIVKNIPEEAYSMNNCENWSAPSFDITLMYLNGKIQFSTHHYVNYGPGYDIERTINNKTESCCTHLRISDVDYRGMRALVNEIKKELMEWFEGLIRYHSSRF